MFCGDGFAPEQKLEIEKSASWITNKVKKLEWRSVASIFRGGWLNRQMKTKVTFLQLGKTLQRTLKILNVGRIWKNWEPTLHWKGIQSSRITQIQKFASQSSFSVDSSRNYCAEVDPIMSAKHDTCNLTSHVPKSIASSTLSPAILKKNRKVKNKKTHWSIWKV